MWEKWETLCIVGGNAKWYSHYGKQYGGSLEIKTRTTILSSNPAAGSISKGDENRGPRDIWAPMPTTALFTAAKMWKPPMCLSTDDWLKKRWYIYTVEHYSALREGNAAMWDNVDEP